MKVDRAARDAEYRRALGLEDGDRLPGHVATPTRTKKPISDRHQHPVGDPKQTRYAFKAKKRASPARLDYESYISSPQWAAKRLEYFAAFGKTCKVPECDDTSHIEVHHHTYERFTQERLTDLVGLCQWHHAAVHDLHGKGGVTLTRATERITGLRLAR